MKRKKIKIRIIKNCLSHDNELKKDVKYNKRKEISD